MDTATTADEVTQGVKTHHYMEPNSVLVYAKADDGTGLCPFCEKAKEWLAGKGIPFTLVELTRGERQVVYDQLGLVGPARTVPQVILADGEGERHRIGGYDDLVVSGIESLFHEH